MSIPGYTFNKTADMFSYGGPIAGELEKAQQMAGTAPISTHARKVTVPNWLKFPTPSNSQKMTAPTVPTDNVAAEFSKATRNAETPDQTKQREARESTHGMPDMAQKFHNMASVAGRTNIDMWHDLPYMATELPQWGQGYLLGAMFPGYKRFFANAQNKVHNSNMCIQNKLYPYHKDTPKQDVPKLNNWVTANNIAVSAFTPSLLTAVPEVTKALKLGKAPKLLKPVGATDDVAKGVNKIYPGMSANIQVDEHAPLVGNMLASKYYKDINRLPNETNTIKGIYGDRINKVNIGLEDTAWGTPSPEYKLSRNDLRTALSFTKPGMVDSSDMLYDVFLEPESAKAATRADDVLQFFRQHINKPKGTVRPIDAINASAGDKLYARNAYDLMLKHLNDPSSGWELSSELSKTRNAPTYVNNKTGQIATPQLLWRDSNARQPFHVLSPSTSNEIYSNNSITKLNELPDVTSTEPYTITDGLAYDKQKARILSDTDIFANTSKPERLRALFGLHELNHGSNSRFTRNGAVLGRIPKGIKLPYKMHPAENSQAAAMFKQQYYRNTGKIISNEQESIDAIKYALNHIEDFDSESRRFLAQILENSADSRKLQSVLGYGSRRTHNDSAFRIDQLKRLLPIVLSIPVMSSAVYNSK